MRVVGRKLFVHPSQVEKLIDLSNQMIWRHYLVQIKRIKELTLSAFPPTHHEPLPQESLQATESWLSDRLNESFATHSPQKRTWFSAVVMSALCQKQTLARLLDYLVCAGEQRLRDSNAEHPRGADVDHQLVSASNSKNSQKMYAEPLMSRGR